LTSVGSSKINQRQFPLPLNQQPNRRRRKRRRMRRPRRHLLLARDRQSTPAVPETFLRYRKLKLSVEVLL
jgi:hypothetical protein